MILAKLPRHVAKRFQQLRNGWILLLYAFFRTRQSDLQESGAQRALASDERGAASRATLLPVVAREQHSFVRDPVDVGSAVSHHSHVVRAQVEPADIVSEDHKNVRLLRRLCVGGGRVPENSAGHRRNSNPGDSCVHMEFPLAFRFARTSSPSRSSWLLAKLRSTPNCRHLSLRLCRGKHCIYRRSSSPPRLFLDAARRIGYFQYP